MAEKKSILLSKSISKDRVKNNEQKLNEKKGAIISKKSFRGKKKPQCV